MVWTTPMKENIGVNGIALSPEDASEIGNKQQRKEILEYPEGHTAKACFCRMYCASPAASSIQDEGGVSQSIKKESTDENCIFRNSNVVKGGNKISQRKEADESGDDK